jgi:hypothetical protein
VGVRLELVIGLVGSSHIRISPWPALISYAGFSMLIKLTRVQVVDSSGAGWVQTFHLYRGA